MKKLLLVITFVVLLALTGCNGEELASPDIKDTDNTMSAPDQYGRIVTRLWGGWNVFGPQLESTDETHGAAALSASAQIFLVIEDPEDYYNAINLMANMRQVVGVSQITISHIGNETDGGLRYHDGKLQLYHDGEWRNLAFED